MLTLAAKKAGLVGQMIDGRYKVLSKLGQGGMGTVYKAEREGMGQLLAIKVLNAEFSNEPEVVRRFLREAKSYGMVQHMNAVALLDFGQLPDGALYIAMEFINGSDLAKYITKGNRLPLTEAVDILSQCCDVLQFAHDKGLVHRDLKPENIMLIKNKRGYHAKVLDFGIARLVTNEATQLTVAGTICGTPRYMSPEQARGREVDARSDIYSLGLVFFEMLTGRQGYTYTAITDLLRAQVTEPVPHVWEAGVTDLPESIDAVIQRACSKDREQRFATMSEFAEAASRAIPTTHVQAYDPSLPRADPAAPGRTFLGPGAQTGSQPSVTNGTGAQLGQDGSLAQAKPLPQPSAEEGRAQTILPLTGSKELTPAEAALSDAHTMFKSQPALPAVKDPSRPRAPAVAETPAAPQKDPSLHLVSERPTPVDRPASKVPLFAVGGVLLLGLVGIGAKVLGGGPSTDIAKPPEVIAKVDPPRPPVDAVKPPDPKPPDPVPTKPPDPVPTVAGTTGAVAVAPTPTPDPVKPPKNDPKTHVLPGQQKPPEPGTDANSRLNELMNENEVSAARSNFIDGKMQSAIDHLDRVPASSPSAVGAKELRAEISETLSLIKQGKAAKQKGDCPEATNLFRQALKHSHSLGEAEAGIRDCEKAAPPAQLDP
jgi:serine/threonine-protein kinase